MTLTAWLKDAQGNRLKEVELSCDAQGNLFMSLGGGATLAEQESQTALLSSLVEAQSGNATPYVDGGNTGAFYFRDGAGWVDQLGNTYNPVGAMSPFGGRGQTVVYEQFTAIDNNTTLGLTIGDQVVQIVFFDNETQVGAAWKNVRTQQYLPGVPQVDVDVVAAGSLADLIKLTRLLLRHQSEVDFKVTIESAVYLPPQTQTVITSGNGACTFFTMTARAENPSAYASSLNGDPAYVSVSLGGVADDVTGLPVYSGGTLTLQDAARFTGSITVYNASPLEGVYINIVEMSQY